MPLPPVRIPIIDCNPPQYVCGRTKMPLGKVDGKLDKPFWQQAKWTTPFHDIEGDSKPLPLKWVGAKLLWDDEYLYIGAKLEDDTIWATVTGRDEVIFFDNDFEVFLAPKDSSHRYYELEMNALNTVWDLMMPVPARDQPNRIIAWDIRGLKSAVHIEGELNNPSADNKFWSLELCIPWEALRECALNACDRGDPAPVPGEVWRLNFSRVEYRVDVVDNKYVKRIDPETGKPYPEYNWVWAPTGVIDIHLPEMWGYLLFAEDDGAVFAPGPDERIKWELRKLYYRQRNIIFKKGAYAADFAELKGDDAWTIQPELYATPNLFEIIAPASDGKRTLHIRQDGYLWYQDL